MQSIRSKFDVFAEWISKNLGHPVAFSIALMLVLLWAISGPLFGFSQTWQLIINTGTTIATFLMVFLLQNSSNRNTKELNDLVKCMADANRKLLAKLNEIEDKVDDE